MAEGPKKERLARRKARKRALDVLFEADLRDLPPGQVLLTYLDRIARPHPDHLEYSKTLIDGVAKNLDRIDELIASYAEGWTIDRMPAVDRNLARIAVYELLFEPDVDDPVAITEAVELAKEMSTDDSPRFLNGLLDRIAAFATR